MGRKSARQKDQDFANVMTNCVRKVWTLGRSFAPKGCSIQSRELFLHDVLLNAIVNHENNMESMGIEVPKKYIEDKVDTEFKRGRTLESNYVMCKRCQFCKKDKEGQHYCTVWRWNINSSRFLTSVDDGCSRDLLKEEYR